VQQQLIALVAGIRLARNRLPSNSERSAAALQEVQDQALGAIRELRELVRGIHPPVLEDAGLVPAIEAVTGRLPLTVRMEVEGIRTERYPARIESAAYFTVCEALTNVVKHAGVDQARVSLQRSNGSLGITVCDEGVGFDDAPAAGSGLAGLRDRVVAVGGELSILSEPGRGTTVAVTLPVGANG
jgi:signal transduction histidine kinase